MTYRDRPNAKADGLCEGDLARLTDTLDGVEGRGEQVVIAYRCADCGWEWPMSGLPPEGAECDNCGGDLEPPF